MDLSCFKNFVLLFMKLSKRKNKQDYVLCKIKGRLWKIKNKKYVKNQNNYNNSFRVENLNIN